jgi:hypothetical protein
MSLVAQMNMIDVVLDREGFAAGADRDALACREGVTQDMLQIGLVHAVARVPALGSRLLRPRPVQQQPPVGVQEAHSRVDPGPHRDPVDKADRLEDCITSSSKCTAPGR